jgi:hypothetical protein
MSEKTLNKKPQFSGHETFPLRQLWLKKAFDAVAYSGYPLTPKSIFADESAIVRFGVGKNMVSSIRFWALACNIIEETEDAYQPTAIGRLLFDKDHGLDPYCEYPATVWLMHWYLASTYKRTATWHYLFNYVVQQVFDRESVGASLSAKLKEEGVKLSESTLKRDIECCIRSYVPKVGGDSPEELSEPLLGELGLLIQNSKGAFEFRRGQKRSLPDGVFGYALLDYWQNLENKSAVMAFDRVAHDYGSPGRVFKLDENSVSERLINLEAISNGELQWTEQAGLRQVTFKGEISKDTTALRKKMLKHAFKKS